MHRAVSTLFGDSDGDMLPPPPDTFENSDYAGSSPSGSMAGLSSLFIYSMVLPSAFSLRHQTRTVTLGKHCKNRQYHRII